MQVNSEAINLEDKLNGFKVNSLFLNILMCIVLEINKMPFISIGFLIFFRRGCCFLLFSFGDGSATRLQQIGHHQIVKH